MRKTTSTISGIITALLFFLIVSLNFRSYAQEKEDSLSWIQSKLSSSPTPVRKFYDLSQYEFIFSGAQVSDSGRTLGNVLRFSLATQYQVHYDFGKHVGMYTGLGLRNIGFINKLNVPNEKDATIKQRCWGLGIPLALKLGNMASGFYVAVGAEEEWMFNYKMKAFFDGNKSKHSAWTSNDVNQFTPSVFLDMHFAKPCFIRFRYYLTDFLVNQTSLMSLPKTATQVNYTPVSSTLFYISVGITEL
ncbi:MAG: hypothetical protein HY840_06510 [Bacteroidetes bacterium]|nr:hypothetical protein [Bacteroidota bacterium]